MIRALVEVLFSSSVKNNKEGAECFKRLLSCGTQEDCIFSTSIKEFCIFHEDVDYRIIKELGDKNVIIEIVFPYCLSGATSGVSEIINSILYCSVFSFVKNYIVLDIFIDDCIEIFKGPRFGIKGIRNYYSIHHLPLLGIVLKPRTKIDLDYQIQTVKKLCDTKMIDYIIEDELVIAPLCCNYKDRINEYSHLIEDIYEKNGKKILYWVNVTSDLDIAMSIIEYALDKQINAFCINPISMGFTAAKYLIDKYEGKAYFLANNIGRGVLSRPPQYYIHERVLAKLSRLIGADAVYTGPITASFPYDMEIIKTEKAALQEGFSVFKPSFAVTSGNIKNGENIQINIKAIGNDVMIQMGGAFFQSNAIKKIYAFSFILNHWQNEDILKEIADAYDAVTTSEKDGRKMTTEKKRLVEKNEHLLELIQKQADFYNELIGETSVTVDARQRLQYSESIKKCEDALIKYTRQLNSLANNNPFFKDADNATYVIVMDIAKDRLLRFDDDDCKDIIDSFERFIRENAQNVQDEDINDRITDYNAETKIRGKLELSIPIIPLLLSYKCEAEVELTKNLRRLIEKFLRKVSV